MIDDVLLWRRGVRVPCARCAGMGAFLYGNGSTWRGGMGVAAMTCDVCDVCWGSGDTERTWTDLRKLELEQEVEVTRRALSWLADTVGASHLGLHDAIGELAGEVERFARGRKKRTPYFAEVCVMLARALRTAVVAGQERRLVQRREGELTR